VISIKHDSVPVDSVKELLTDTEGVRLKGLPNCVVGLVSLLPLCCQYHRETRAEGFSFPNLLPLLGARPA